MGKVIEVLRGVEDKWRRFCDDFGDRKGCGQEVKIKTNANGKKGAYEPVKIPCMDDDGKTVWAWVPHWVTCPNQKEYYIEFLRKQADKDYEYHAKRKQNADDNRQEAPF